jgi:surface protein
MDFVTIKLIERDTCLPLDLVIMINSFLYEILIDDNFREALEIWVYGEKEECLLRFGHISYWDTSRVTDMSGIFLHHHHFNDDISRWNVSHVKNMCSMFYHAREFNGDISRWDVSNVTGMAGMFDGASNFNGDLSRWNVGKVKDMNQMFQRAIQFNGDISQWDVSNSYVSGCDSFQ